MLTSLQASTRKQPPPPRHATPRTPQRSGGYFAAAELAAAMQWTPQRARHAVQELLASGLGWLDQGPPGDGAPATYWVPGVGMDQAIAAFVRADPR